MTTIDDLAARAKLLADARAHLGDLVGALQAGIDALRDNEMPAIRLAIETAALAWVCLEKDIREHPELFVKPRKVAAHGISFGIEKSRGALQIPDPDRTVELIRKHLPEQAAVLIDVKATPAKKAIEALPAKVLKQIGVQVIDGTDTVVIRPAKSDVDKLVAAIVKAEVAEADSAAAAADAGD